MIQTSIPFNLALKRGEMPIILAIMSNTSDSRYAYGKVDPRLDIVYSSFWDGEREFGQGTYGDELGLIDAGARVLNFGSIDTSIAYSNKDLLLSLTNVAIGSMQVVFSNADLYFSDLLGGDKAVSFLNSQLQITCHFASIGWDDHIELFNGTIIDEQISYKTFKIVAEAKTSTLLDPFILPRSGRYSSPAAENDILPYVYGNTSENSAQGVSVCPCIDTTNHIYCLSCHALPASAVVTLYDDTGVLTSGYTITQSGDYESQGVIAYATLAAEPNGTLSMTTTVGKDSLTNPIDIIEDILIEAGDITVHNRNTWLKAWADAKTLNYIAAGVLAADQSPSYWLTNILTNFLGSWYLNNANELVLLLDSSEMTSNVTGVLREYQSIMPSGSRTRQNICNQLAVNYGYVLTDIDRRFKENANPQYLLFEDGNSTKDSTSIAKYGQLTKTLDFQWIRNTTTVNTIQSRVVSRYPSPMWVITYPESVFRNLLVEPGDMVYYSWEAQEDDEGQPIKNQIGRVLKITRDLDALTCTFDLQDMNAWAEVNPYIWNGEHTYGELDATYGATRDRRTL